MPKSFIPATYRKIAETFDQYKHCTVSIYYSRKHNWYLIRLKNTEKNLGPFVKAEIDVMHHVLSDVIEMRGKYRELKDDR